MNGIRKTSKRRTRITAYAFALILLAGIWQAAFAAGPQNTDPDIPLSGSEPEFPLTSSSMPENSSSALDDAVSSSQPSEAADPNAPAADFGEGSSSIVGDSSSSSSSLPEESSSAPEDREQASEPDVSSQPDPSPPESSASDTEEPPSSSSPELPDPEDGGFREDPEEPADEVLHAVTITAGHVIVGIGDTSFGLLDGVSAEDESGEPVPVAVETTGGFDIHTAGEYLVGYRSVHPVTGEVFQAQRIVKVSGGFQYDPQPTGPIDIDLAAVLNGSRPMPRWEYAIDEALIPEGWQLVHLSDGENGLMYWTLVLIVTPAAPQSAGISLESELTAALEAQEPEISLAGDIQLTAPLRINYSVVFRSAEGAPVTLYAPASRHMIMNGGGAEFENIILDGSNSGGGIQITGGLVSLSGTRITNCLAYGDGGGILVDDGCEAVLDNVSIQGNRAANGAGIYVGASGTVTLLNGRVSGNTTMGNGGGICGVSGIIDLSGTEISGNTALRGGGVYGSVIHVSGGAISGNQADSGGGIYAYGTYSADSLVNISGGIISGNSASQNGGGLYLTGEAVMNQWTAIRENRAASGGGIYAEHLPLLDISDGTVRFEDNRADSSYIVSAEDAALYAFSPLTVTSPFEHLLNNYDINYAGPSPAFTVTFQSNGGSEIPSLLIDAGQLITERPVPAKNGDVFQGWYKDEQFTDPWDFDTDVVTGNITLYAKWLVNYHTVTFQSNEGSAVSSLPVETGALIIKPEDPVREGYSFSGWYKDEALTVPWSFETDRVTGSLTLYAKWEQRLTVRFDLNGGSGIESLAVSVGDLLSKPEDPVFADHSFMGWFRDPDLTIEWNFETDAVQDSMTLYAKWAKKTYTVTFVSRSSTFQTQVVVAGGKIAKPSNPIRSGYYFDGWYKDSTMTIRWNFSTDTVHEDTTLYAGWSSKSGSSSGSSRSSGTRPKGRTSIPSGSSRSPAKDADLADTDKSSSSSGGEKASSSASEGNGRSYQAPPNAGAVEEASPPEKAIEEDSSALESDSSAPSDEDEEESVPVIAKVDPRDKEPLDICPHYGMILGIVATLGYFIFRLMRLLGDEPMSGKGLIILDSVVFLLLLGSNIFLFLVRQCLLDSILFGIWLGVAVVFAVIILGLDIRLSRASVTNNNPTRFSSPFGA